MEVKNNGLFPLGWDDSLNTLNPQHMYKSQKPNTTKDILCLQYVQIRTYTKAPMHPSTIHKLNTLIDAQLISARVQAFVDWGWT